MSPDNPKKNLIRGAAWKVSSRWIIKALGFLNTIIMARLLMPEDYGIVAMGMLVVSLIQTFLDFGATTALLRKTEVTVDEINSAWTLRMIQGLIAALVLLLVTPLAVDYFTEDRLKHVLWTFAACVFLASASNISPTLATREFNFAFNFKLETTAKLISVATTLLFGYLLGDYRALILGITAGFLTPLVLSYAWHPYRPRWNTSKIPEIWAVTKWLLFANIGSFVLRRSDEIVAGRIGSTHEFGLYNVGSDFGQLPVGEIGPAMMQALLPVLASIQEDIERTRAAVIKTIAAVSTVIWPLGIGFIAVAPQATEVVLGAKWLDAVPIAMAYALVSIFKTTLDPFGTLMILRGHAKATSQIIWIEFGTFALCAFLLVPSYHLLGLAMARVIGAAVSTVVFIGITNMTCGLPVLPAAGRIARPMIGTLLMYGLIHYLAGLTSSVPLQLVVSIASGVVFFSIWSLLTWYIVGRPEGLESTIIDKLTDMRRRRNR